MSARLRRHASVLQTLASAKPPLQKAIIKNASNDLVNCLCECALNILKGHVPLKSRQKKLLCRHKQVLRSLAKKNISVPRKRKLIQKGGFLGALIGPLLGAVIPAISSLFTRK